DSGGRKRAIFGDGYQRGGPIAREELSQGPIACLPNGDVVVAFTYLPAITAYDQRGAVKWSVDLPGFVPLTSSEERGYNGVGFVSSYDYAGELVQSLVALGGEARLVQVARLAAARPERPSSQSIVRRDTYLISAISGRGT